MIFLNSGKEILALMSFYWGKDKLSIGTKGDKVNVRAKRNNWNIG